MDIEARLERLESFIGNIDQIKLYANSLQEVIDRYLAPLYIEMGSDKTMLINDYLGDLNNIPHNVIFKIRSSHNLTLNEGEDAVIKFQRGTDFTEYTMKKLVSGSLVSLESSNYTAGEVYDIYINSQDIAVITANDTGVRALSEVAALTTALDTAVNNLTNTINSNYNTLDTKIDTNAASARAYTDTKHSENSTAIGAINTLLSGITKVNNGYRFSGNIYSNGVESESIWVTRTVNLSGASGFVLPSGTTIADPSSNLGLSNRQWVTSYVNTYVADYFSRMHFTGTSAAETAMAGKPNGSFYYKLSS